MSSLNENESVGEVRNRIKSIANNLASLLAEWGINAIDDADVFQAIEATAAELEDLAETLQRIEDPSIRSTIHRT